MKATKMLD